MLLQVVCTGPHSPVCSTLELHKKSSQFFLWCGKVGGCLVVVVVVGGGGGGHGGGGPCFRR